MTRWDKTGGRTYSWESDTHWNEMCRHLFLWIVASWECFQFLSTLQNPRVSLERLTYLKLWEWLSLPYFVLCLPFIFCQYHKVTRTAVQLYCHTTFPNWKEEDVKDLWAMGKIVDCEYNAVSSSSYSNFSWLIREKVANSADCIWLFLLKKTLPLLCLPDILPVAKTHSSKSKM